MKNTKGRESRSKKREINLSTLPDSALPYKYMISYPTAEGRKRKRFKTKASAIDFKDTLLVKQENHSNIHASVLTPEIERIAAEGHMKLKELGSSLFEAIENQLKQLKAQGKGILLVDAYDDYCKLKEGLQGKRPKSKVYLRDIHRIVGSFVESHKHESIAAIRPEKIHNHIELNCRGAIAYNTAFRTLKAFFNHGVKKQWIDKIPFHGLEEKELPIKRPEYFSASSCKWMLSVLFNESNKVSSNKKIIFLLGLFAGIRPFECERLKYSDIHFDVKKQKDTNNSVTEYETVSYVSIGIDQSKKSKARNVILSSVAVEWLKPLINGKAKDKLIWEYNNDGHSLRRVRELFEKKDPCFKWIRDGLRHTFATYYRAIHNIHATSSQLGHSSISITETHYADAIPFDLANDFWSLTPEKVAESNDSKVIQFQSA